MLNHKTIISANRDEIERYLKDNNYDVSKRMLPGSIPKIAEEIGIPHMTFKHYLQVIRGTKNKSNRFKTHEERIVGKIDAPTNKVIREVVNKRVGSDINIREFIQRDKAASYLSILTQRGFLQRVYTGEYKILKKITLKKKGPGKGRRTNQRVKDLSAIPAVLNSSTEGLVMPQIYEAYKRITPPGKEVNVLYLYRLFEFMGKKGVIGENGVNPKFKRAKKGPIPKRFILLNKNITPKEWEDLVDQYRMWYQFKKENKVKKHFKRKTVMSKINSCDSINNNFGEDRDNPNKKYVEDFFIQKVKTRLGDDLIRCLVVTGPDYNHHMNSLFTSFSKKVLVCEIAPDVFDTIYRKAQICPYHIDHKVSLLKCDVSDIAAVDCRYADIDLMRTLKNNYNIIYNQITRQDLLCKKGKEKFFTFTCTRRNQESFEVTISYLKKLAVKCFGMKLTGLSSGTEVRGKHKRLRSCKQHFPSIEKYGRVKEMHVFTYQDDVPMMNVLFVYK